jgi:cytochrome c-type biogenesis protein CcmH
MSGWLMLAGLLMLALIALRAMGLRGGLLQLAAAALMFGSAGYAWQGRPGLAESRRPHRSNAAPIPLASVRHAFFGQFTGSERWLLIADSYAARGNTEDAVGVLRAAVREHPGDPELWVGLGNALVDRAGILTPASQLAFARAEELAPGHPAAPFFRGLALARSGDGGKAVAEWRELLARAPANASWRPLVEDAISALTAPRRR